MSSRAGCINTTCSAVCCTSTGELHERIYAPFKRTGHQLGSRALVADSVETWVCSYLSLALLAGVGLYQLFGWWWADAVGALAMLPVIVWQGWETFGEAGEHDDHEDAADVH
jgi:divalent metal cation (Fe/Co/Zn/Cd) transporter